MPFRHKIITITLLAIALGFLENAVVIYLRELLYPDGFQFPLSPIPVDLAVTELLRELSTLVILFNIGMLAGKSFSERFAWFCYVFAIWDIFYYVFLKLMLGWPESLMTWDILFLIPTTWTGPVITPLIVSATLILFALVILLHANRGVNTRIKPLEWSGLIMGSLLLILGFILDYSNHMLGHFTLVEMSRLKNPEVLEVAMQYVPARFPWWIFISGEVIILGTIWRYGRRLGKGP
ncbi:MAG: hypothetical protein JXR52_10560 [Bacteroidales bacterium]|nr:hypothetical protein [Bacteroidales bacterium]